MIFVCILNTKLRKIRVFVPCASFNKIVTSEKVNLAYGVLNPFKYKVTVIMDTISNKERDNKASIQNIRYLLGKLNIPCAILR